MAIEGEYRIAAPRTVVWNALNDPEVLKACIPGCEALTRLSDTEIDARVNAALGPVRSVFATRIQLSDLAPPSGYTISGEGKSAVGGGKGTARVELAEDGDGTRLRYTADLRLSGKLAQVGSRLLEGATRQLADQFFETFAKRLDQGAVREDVASPAATAPASTGTGARVGWWAAGAIAIVILLWLLWRLGR